MEKTLEVSPNVVWIENHIHDSSSSSHYPHISSSNAISTCSHPHMADSDDDDDEEDGHELEHDGEWTILPNGTKQVLYNLTKMKVTHQAWRHGWVISLFCVRTWTHVGTPSSPEHEKTM